MHLLNKNKLSVQIERKWEINCTCWFFMYVKYTVLYLVGSRRIATWDFTSASILLVKGEPLGGKWLTGPICPYLFLNPSPARPQKTGAPFSFISCRLFSSNSFSKLPHPMICYSKQSRKWENTLTQNISNLFPVALSQEKV